MYQFQKKYIIFRLIIEYSNIWWWPAIEKYHLLESYVIIIKTCWRILFFFRKAWRSVKINVKNNLQNFTFLTLLNSLGKKYL